MPKKNSRTESPRRSDQRPASQPKRPPKEDIAQAAYRVLQEVIRRSEA